jgi:UDP-N-acetyl-D-galactosamine dehydrogenase
MELFKKKIAVIGLGYVGLPLAVEFGKKYHVLGFDINETRINQLKNGIDNTLEASKEEIMSSLNLRFSSNQNDLKNHDIYIVTVPTPVDKFKTPDLKPLLNATSMLGEIINTGAIIIYESTVYPGCTEEECVPLLEKKSGLVYNKDFFCGYSPERINPGDKLNTLTKIIKVTSGSTTEIADVVDSLYRSIIIAGTHKASCMKIAEASKAIENAQRDLNISFVNELALIFDKIGIDTQEVLDAAGTKWNFLKFKPGLVGGHCIGVDPYYLSYKAESMGYYPQVILSGRRVNDNVPSFIVNKVIRLMIHRSLIIKDSNALILGVTFKENCPDIRNSKVVYIYNELIEYGFNITVYDPNANANEVKLEYGINLADEFNKIKYDVIILAVSHDEFLNIDYTTLKRNKNSIVFDTKSCLPKEMVDCRL